MVALAKTLLALLLVPTLVVLAPASVSVAAPSLPPQAVLHSPDVSSALHQDVSPPLREIAVSAPSAANLRERPLRLIPTQGPTRTDTAVQSSAGPAISSASGLSFDGVGQGFVGKDGSSFSVQYAPPDTNGAVGASQYVQWVNTAFAVFDKASGSLILGPALGNSLWKGFGGGCETNNDGDPIVQYDKAGGRWVMTQFSVSTTPYLQCVAVSTTSDATGTYNRYAFSYGNTQFPDYPKLGVWPDAYYVSYNIFNNGSTFAGAKICAFDRASMLTGAAATQQCFQLTSSYGGLLPADLDSATAPPTGAPGYFLNFTSNALNLWKFHVDFANSGNTTLAGPSGVSGVAPFTPACGTGGTCVPQPGTTQKLDSLGDRLMYRLSYRNFGDHESMVVNHSVSVQLGGNGRKGNSTVGVRWYELRDPGGTPFVYQQGTYSPDATYRWMGSIAMDKMGNIAVGYSASGSSVYPSIRFTGRVPTDALNTLEGESQFMAGTGSQQRNLSRWGDYSAMSVDPADQCTFWYTNEYLKSNGTWNWNTRINSFKFPGCQ